jgi:uncharacterized protein (TIGR02145 family)
MRTLIILQVIFLFALSSVLAQSLNSTITGTFTDSRDEHVYKWVKIGNQVWMAENLAYLPAVSPPMTGSNIEPYYYVYDYFGSSVAEAKATAKYVTIGVLYNWLAAKAACPSSWHLPKDTEWKQLEMKLGMTQKQADSTGYRGTDQGTQMKSASGWNNSGYGSNSSGFSAIPGGCRYSGNHFFNITLFGYWWSATEDNTAIAWNRYVSVDYAVVNRGNAKKEYGFSVRCVKN